MIKVGSRVRVRRVAEVCTIPYLEEFIGLQGEVVAVCERTDDAQVRFAHNVLEMFFLSELEVVDPCEEVTSAKQDSDHNAGSS